MIDPHYAKSCKQTPTISQPTQPQPNPIVSMKKTTMKTAPRNPKPPKGGGRNRALTHDHYVDLCLYIQPRADELRAKPPVFAKLAEQLSGELGFPVAPTSLSKVCRRFGITPSCEFAKPRKGSALAERVAALEEKVERLTALLEGTRIAA